WKGSTDISPACRFNVLLLTAYSCTEGPIAQRLELAAHNRLVPGSNPGGPTTRAVPGAKLLIWDPQRVPDPLTWDPQRVPDPLTWDPQRVPDHPLHDVHVEDVHRCSLAARNAGSYQRETDGGSTLARSA